MSYETPPVKPASLAIVFCVNPLEGCRASRRRIASRILVSVGGSATEAIASAIHDFADKEGLKLGQIAQPLRAALCGTTTSPGIFEVAEILGKEEVLGRLEDVAAT